MRIGIVVLALLAAPAAAFGSEGGHGGEGQAQHVRDFKNEAAAFLGWTDEKGHDAEFTWGFDYKRRVADRWAVGGAFDYAGGELRNSVLLGLAFFWPGLGNLQLLAGPGVEFHEGRGGDGHGHGGKADEDETHFLFRLGIAYDIHLGERFGIVPNVNLDLVDGENVWVYGLAFTYGW
jgi:hypothetical protein